VTVTELTAQGFPPHKVGNLSFSGLNFHTYSVVGVDKAPRRT